MLLILSRAGDSRDLLWATVIASALGFVGVMVAAVIAYSNHRQGRRISEQVQPENGMRLGELVEQVSKTVDVIDGRVHDGSKRADRLETAVDRVEEKVDAIDGRVRETSQRLTNVGDKLDGHIEDSAPLLARAIRDWGPEGTKEA